MPHNYSSTWLFVVVVIEKEVKVVFLILIFLSVFQILKFKGDNWSEDFVLARLGTVGLRAVVVLGTAALILNAQLSEGVVRWEDVTCEMLSRLSLSEEKEKLFLNCTDPFPELSLGPVLLHHR